MVELHALTGQAEQEVHQSAGIASPATLQVLRRLLGSQPMRVTRMQNTRYHDVDNDEDDEDDGVYDPVWDRRRPPRGSGKWFTPVEEPQKAGVDLLMSGEFGRVQRKIDTQRKRDNVAKALLARRSRLRRTYREDITSVSIVCITLYVTIFISCSRLLFLTPTEPLSLLTITIFILASSLTVRASRTSYQNHQTILSTDSMFYYTCCQGMCLPVA